MIREMVENEDQVYQDTHSHKCEGKMWESVTPKKVPTLLNRFSLIRSWMFWGVPDLWIKV